MPNILITGAAGFIGSNLVEHCLNAGFNVDAVDDLSNGHVEFLPRTFHVGNLFIKDFADESVLQRIRSGKYDVVVHLAAIPRVGYSVEHPIETNDVNLSKTLRLIEACRGNIGLFIFASSSSVYGPTDNLPSLERHVKNPNSPYALQKSCVEEYLSLYNRLYGFSSVSLRFFNVYGPNCLGDSPYSTVVSAWLNAIKRGQPMRSDGDGSQSRDMCYVGDVAKAIVNLIAAPSGTFDAHRYNVASGSAVTNSQIMTWMKTTYPGAKHVDAPLRVGDVPRTLASIDELQRVIVYNPTDFWTGLKITRNWFESNWDLIKSLRLNK